MSTTHTEYEAEMARVAPMRERVKALPAMVAAVEREIAALAEGRVQRLAEAVVYGKDIDAVVDEEARIAHLKIKLQLLRWAQAPAEKLLRRESSALRQLAEEPVDFEAQRRARERAQAEGRVTW